MSSCLPVHLQNVVVDVERLIRGETHQRLGCGYLVIEDRVAVHSGRVVRIRRWRADVGSNHHKGWPVGNAHCSPDACFDLIEILADFAEFLDMPSVGTKPLGGIV